MNILILNGSPKGKYSTTLHTCLYLQKKFSEHSFEILHVGQRIKAIEKDLGPSLEAIGKADMLLFSYPVYTFIAPAQLHRFIELVKESGIDISGKVATQVTTSKHFYDITAHRYIEDNCADMGLKFIDGLSADMDDLLTEKGRMEAEDWFRFTLWNISKGYFKEPSAKKEPFTALTAGKAEEVAKKDGQKVVIVADVKEGDAALQAMIDRFRAVLPYECDYVNIEEFPFQGGCLSCFNCSTDGACIYKDGFDKYLREYIHKHDAIVYAFSVKDHSMGVRFKTYDDRQFCNGHRTVTMGTPFAYLVDGPYSKEANLQLIVTARAEVGGNLLAGVATDETAPDTEIERLAATLSYAMETRYTPPQNFLGIGGMKIFRDLIYLMRGMMRADHKFFKSHGQYDFPQKKWKTSMMMYLVGYLMGNKKLKTKMGSKMNDGMIAAYKKVVDEA